MTAGQQAISDCLAAYRAGLDVDPDEERVAVKYLLDLLREIAPGNSVEVRIPPYAAAQIVAGTKHRRGNPPATVECDARTFIQLAIGEVVWADAIANGGLKASGERSDLSGLLPLRDLAT